MQGLARVHHGEVVLRSKPSTKTMVHHTSTKQPKLLKLPAAEACSMHSNMARFDIVGVWWELAIIRGPPRRVSNPVPRADTDASLSFAAKDETHVASAIPQESTEMGL
jgi:hypothetical protein